MRTDSLPELCPELLNCVLLSVLLASCAGGASEAPRPNTDRGAKVDAGAEWANDVADGSFVRDTRASFNGGPRFGEPCVDHGDCEGGWCAATGAGRLCTANCVDACPQGWACVASNLFGGTDLVSVCLPDESPTCGGCEGDQDCRGASFCAWIPNDKPVCLLPCDPLAGSTCPGGFACVQTASSPHDKTVNACLPKSGYGCCSLASKGATESCARVSEFGRCVGERSCMGAGGWSVCDATLPGLEVCDGRDNDCDGAADEGLGPQCSCGDGVCSSEGGEGPGICIADCPPACGDGACTPGEDPGACPEDCCGGCGDGLCLGYGCKESPSACPVDCGTACGNATCDKGESPAVCPEDCRRYVCGNGVCEPTDGGPEECPADCASACGDCVCQGGEGFQSCPVDCGFCGDLVCSLCPHLDEKEQCRADCEADPGQPPGPVVVPDPADASGSDVTHAQDGGRDATDSGPCPDGCDDGDSCTVDVCLAGGCDHSGRLRTPACGTMCAPKLGPRSPGTFVAGRGRFMALAVNGDHAYVAAANAGMQVLSLPAGGGVQPAGMVDLGGVAVDIAYADGHVYVADETHGLVAIDVSDPASPREVGRLDLSRPGYFSTLHKVDVDGTAQRAYALMSFWVDAIDISDPSSPRRLGTFESDTFYPRDVVAVGNRAYLAANEEGLQIIDFADPASPSILGGLAATDPVETFALDGGFAYLSVGPGMGHGYLVDGLGVMDLSNPAAPTMRGVLPDLGWYLAIAARDGFVFAGTWQSGLKVVDARDPDAPVQATSRLEGYHWSELRAREGELVASYEGRSDDGGLARYEVDASGGLSSFGATERPTFRAYGIEARGDVAFVGDGEGTLSAWTVGGETGLERLSTLPIGEAARGVEIDGDLAYVLLESSTRAFDISNPMAMREVGSVGFASYGSAFGFDGGIVVAHGEGEGLGILDFSDPAAPRRRGTMATEDGFFDLRIANKLVYLVDIERDLRIIDVADPDAPRLAGTLEVMGQVTSIELDASRAYLGHQNIHVIDVANPSAPSALFEADLPTGWSANHLLVHGHQLYASCGRQGILVYELSHYDPPELRDQVQLYGRAGRIAPIGDTLVVATASVGLEAVKILCDD
jgi:hypothetical protein